MNKKYLEFRTDMADERVDMYKKVNNLSKVDGIRVTSFSNENVIVTEVEVLNENGENVIKKQKGKYITIQIQDFDIIDENEKENIQKNISEEIKKVIKDINANSFMIVGLGNDNVTPDALGPGVVKYIDITRHLIKYASNLVKEGTKEISAISPGVLGTTGIETYEIIRSVVNSVKPDALIVIDSLASGSIHRIGNTVQISNTGITPGEGVKNKRESLDKESLGIPVIAIGVPTVVDMATITNEAIDKLVEDIKNEIKNYSNTDCLNDTSNKECIDIFKIFENDTRYDMIANALNTNNYIVTPKEVDELILKMSEIIANSINISLSK